MKNAHRMFIAVAACTAAAAAASSASADTESQYLTCKALGGSVKACCAAIGGTYNEERDATGHVVARSCTFTNRPDHAQAPPETQPSPNNGDFVRPATGVATSEIASDGRSRAGDNGVVQIVDLDGVIPEGSGN